MKKLAKSLQVMILVLPLFFLSGCWGNLEVEETAYILAIGFDQGKDDNLKITFQIANPKEIGSGSKGNKAYVFDTLEAPLPIAGYSLLNTIHTRKISLLHTKAYIFSEELAKKGIENILYPLIMYRETRGSSYVFVCRGKAEEVMSKETINLESNPARQFELLDALSNKLGFTAMVTLSQFYQENKNHSAESFLPLIGLKEKDTEPKTKTPADFGDYLPGEMPEKESSIQFLGTAIFVNHKMRGKLTGEETRYLLMLQGKLSESVLVLPDPIKPEYKIGMTLRQKNKPEWKFDLESDPLKIKGEIDLEVFLTGVPSDINFASYANKKKLEQAIVKSLQKKNQELLEKAQKKYKADILHLWEKAKWRFINNKSWMAYDWQKNFLKAQIDLQFKVEVQQTGKQIRTD